MENLKVKVDNLDESKEVQELFVDLGATNEVRQITSKWVCLYNGQITFYDLLPNVDFKQVTLQYLRDLVVLKRNDIKDANYESEIGKRKYYLTSSEFFEFINGAWVNIDELADGMSFKSINKEDEVKKKEYIAKVSGDWRLVDSHELVSGRIEVPEGAEILLLDESCGEDTLYFVKHDGEVFHEYYISGANIPHNSWTKGTIKGLHKYMGEVLWQRNTPRTLDRKSIETQYKLKFIEKWLNGEKIQYILGVESEKTQWHNFTEGAMQYIKRPDIKLREAPKYVTINGIEFKSIKSLLKHVKNNFDLEDVE